MVRFDHRQAAHLHLRRRRQPEHGRRQRQHRSPLQLRRRQPAAADHAGCEHDPHRLHLRRRRQPRELLGRHDHLHLQLRRGRPRDPGDAGQRREVHLVARRGGQHQDLPGVRHRRHHGRLHPELHLLREQPHPDVGDQGQPTGRGRRRLRHQHDQHARQVGPADQGGADRHQEREQDHRVPAHLHGRRPRDDGHRDRRHQRDLGQLVIDLRRQRPPDPARPRPERQPGIGRVQALHLQQRRPDPAPLPRRRRRRHRADDDHAVPVRARQPGRRDRQRHRRQHRHRARQRGLRPGPADRRGVPDRVGDRLRGQVRRHAAARSRCRSTATRACGS